MNFGKALPIVILTGRVEEGMGWPVVPPSAEESAPPLVERKRSRGLRPIPADREITICSACDGVLADGIHTGHLKGDLP